jgi:serine/threonine protein kinase/Flp pilus assembly protein TadD
MNPEQWQEVKGVFQRALQLSAVDRSSYLESFSEPVRRQVESLLRAYEQNNDFLELSFRAEHDGQSTAEISIGQSLSGRYRIERMLGEGGMGVVYLARDEQVAGETFAIKVLKEALYPEALERLREEVHKTRKLSHPNIVDVHSVNVDGKRVYVLMEYLEGKSLGALLDEEFGRGMPFSHAWPIIEDIGAALGNAHDHNVIHSDLKPANVFVTTSGRTKLLDFGIARVSRGPLLHARSGPLALTPAYASCEMLEGKEADRRDDIYSFACVIYEMLCGESPFGELTALEAREARARIPRLAVLTQGQNAALARALAFDREGRTSSVEELLEALAADHKTRRRPIATLGTATIVGLAAVGLTYLVLDKLWISKPAAPAVFDPPPHSIAVLPFVNLSGDKEQEYFSDGLTEELLNSLSQINDLQVAARTSSFSFKEHPDIVTVAHKLNVAAVLEGSVRRSAQTVRVTAQLINAVTGFHVWSKTYDRDLNDVLKLQTEIATAVAEALEVTLLGDISAKIELGGTRSPAAFDAYLRASKAYQSRHEGKDIPSAIVAYTEAIRLDPNYALAFAGRSLALNAYTAEETTGAAIREGFEKAEADARQAIALAPELAEAHLALAYVLELGTLDFAGAREEYERALALAPGNAQVLRDSGEFAAFMGHFDEGIGALRRAVMLDPLARSSHYALGLAQYAARRYGEATRAFAEAMSLEPYFKAAYGYRGLAFYGLGDLQRARASCDTNRDYWGNQWCLAVVYDKLGRRADAEAELARMRQAAGDAAAYQYATIYAQWGNLTKAFEWLDTAMRLRDPGLELLKTDPLFDTLRKEPRFQAIERALKFPE